MQTLRPLLFLAAITCGGMAHAQEDTTLNVATSDEFGRYLVDQAGLPVYLFDTSISAGDGLAPLASCAERCREQWPLVTVAGELVLDDQLDPELATTVTDEGETIAVYDSNVLFYFYQDTETSGPIGHGIRSHGGRWFLVAPNGAAIPAD